jgi:hypothetical protein
MSNTRKHKDKGKWNNGLLEEVPDNLQNMWNRHNNDWAEFRAKKKEIEEKIAEKEMKQEIKTVETGENIDFDIPEQDEILNQIMGRS